jgi:ribose 5-phosphate isomerase B
MATRCFSTAFFAPWTVIFTERGLPPTTVIESIAAESIARPQQPAFLCPWPRPGKCRVDQVVHESSTLTFPAEVRIMRVAIGADHAGFELKEQLKEYIAAAGHSVLDLGTDSTESVDYPDYSAAVGRAVLAGRADRGIVVCGSGAGAAIAANKLDGVRCAQATDTYTAHQAVEHDDVNLLALAARVTGLAVAEEIVTAYLGAEFIEDERFIRRRNKVLDLERTHS